MNELAWIGAAVGGVLLATAAVSAAWWQHLRQAELLRRLARLEQARSALERHARETDERLHTLATSLEALRALPAADDVATRRRLLEDALARADAAAAATLAGQVAAVPWKDTEPLPLPDTCYAPTMPMELQPEQRAFGERSDSERVAGVRSTVKP